LAGRCHAALLRFVIGLAIISICTVVAVFLSAAFFDGLTGGLSS
jgi:hypothetical protein